MANLSSATTTELLVDKLIGTPYEFVKFVAQHISLVQVVAKALVGLVGTEPLITKRALVMTGAMAALGQSISFALPAGTDTSKIRAVTVRLTASTGTRYFNDSRYFHSSVTALNLVVDLRADALAVLVNAPMSAFITMDA